MRIGGTSKMGKAWAELGYPPLGLDYYLAERVREEERHQTAERANHGGRDLGDSVQRCLHRERSNINLDVLMRCRNTTVA